MEFTAIAALVEEFGPTAVKLIEELVTTIEKKGSVTADEWAAIKSKGSNTSADVMLTALQKAGIDPKSDQGKALLAAAQ